MKALTKTTAFALTAIMTCALFLCAHTGTGARANGDGNEIKTEMFLPTSLLQYYELSDPYAICRYVDDEGEEVVAISQKNSIVVYRNEKFRSIPLNLSGNSQPKFIDRFDNYVLYLYSLKIYAVDMNGFNDEGWNAEEKTVQTGITCYTFSVCGNRMAYADESNLYLGELSVNDGEIEFTEKKTIEAERISALYYSPDETICYASSTRAGVFRITGDGETLLSGEENLREVRSITGDGQYVYISVESGICRLGSDGTCELIKSSSSAADKDLGEIFEPLGLCVTSANTLWVVDGEINAVQEIDLGTLAFTDFAITTNSKAVNRLSAGASDICVDGDKIYALDGDRIVVINDIDGENSYNRITLDGNAEFFAAGGGYLLAGRQKKLSVFSITETNSP
ncbi:MAG: hypothetical protein J5903_01275, partial [Clostridia bacterium]|nr:hypothetical protein [Clostridia bacterium]